VSKKPAKNAVTDDCKGTYAFVSLGCPKNLVDSERMLGLLKIDGYQLVNEPEGADFVVVNTCGFIDRAKVVQDVIGDHQDACVAEDRLRALALRGGGKTGLAAGRLVERQRRGHSARQSPLLPPVLLTRRTASMTIPFSAALSMS